MYIHTYAQMFFDMRINKNWNNKNERNWLLTGKFNNQGNNIKIEFKYQFIKKGYKNKKGLYNIWLDLNLGKIFHVAIKKSAIQAAPQTIFKLLCLICELKRLLLFTCFNVHMSICEYSWNCLPSFACPNIFAYMYTYVHMYVPQYVFRKKSNIRASDKKT